MQTSDEIGALTRGFYISRDLALSLKAALARGSAACEARAMYWLPIIIAIVIVFVIAPFVAKRLRKK